MQTDLSRREREILEIIYRLGECTANEIVGALNDDVANATVRTQLRSLESKGAVNHRRVGKRYVYRPAVPRKSAAASALRRVLDVFFAGSVEDALAAHLADPKTELTGDEIKRLRKLLNAHSRGEKR
ncbi:BlaI/MecI/CopY family transcriptional regulator [Roseiconus nitratireducens]|uniref:BlaI/MecI/CopY family transcriptional regulator n=1 Tax=Roseiconus nitratireducens TaxID=2605748 RepID=UPI001375E6FD|nr:BlaI/MecI/CopY family transcriptional regulator [Roseiconus nitratireducens]